MCNIAETVIIEWYINYEIHPKIHIHIHKQQQSSIRCCDQICLLCHLWWWWDVGNNNLFGIFCFVYHLLDILFIIFYWFCHTATLSINLSYVLASSSIHSWLVWPTFNVFVMIFLQEFKNWWRDGVLKR